MSNLLTIPRSTTWDVLESSRNQAAVRALTVGLASTQDELRHRCLKSLMGRNEEAARRAILVNWEGYNEADIALLSSRSALFVEAARSLLSSGSTAEKRSTLVAVSVLDITELIDLVLEIAVDATHALSHKATESLSQMCVRWGAKARNGKDVPTIRGRLLERLFNQLSLFRKHKSLHLVDAWLSLVHWDDSLQRGLITDSRHDAYRACLQRLRENEHPAVIQLLAGYLTRSATPKNVLEILIEHKSPALAVAIAEQNDSHTLHGMLKRLQSQASLRCLATIESDMPTVGVEIERRLWMMVAASTNDLGQVLRGAIRLSKLGTREARQTAAEMLRLCRSPELEELVSAIQAAEFEAAENDQCLGNLIRQIAGWLNGPSLVLKKAAREFLKEFSVDNLLGQVRHWPTQMCKSMAGIVVLVEPEVTERLTRELQSPAPRRRLAALQATQLLKCADKVSQTLMPLLDDPRLEVRVRTIDLLGALGHSALEQLIPDLLLDASTDIQDAANRAVRRMKRLKNKTAVK